MRIYINVNELSFLTQDSLQDKYDKLCEDFAAVSKETIDLQEELKSEEVQSAARSADKSGKDPSGKKSLSNASDARIAELKSKLQKLDMDKTRVMDLMKTCTRDIEMWKTGVPAGEAAAVRFAEEPPTKSKKAKK